LGLLQELVMVLLGFMDLSAAGYSEMLEIEGENGETVSAFALNLMEDEIGAVLLDSDVKVKAGAKVKLSGQVLEVPSWT
jgi:F-type H+/Na+-transporting ATPase subunit alpha